MRLPFLFLTVTIATPLYSLSDVTVKGNENGLREIQSPGLRGLQYAQVVSEPMLENQIDIGSSIHEHAHYSEKENKQGPITTNSDFLLGYEPQLKEVTRRRLLELHWDTTPENDIHSTSFSGYQNSHIDVEEWMVEFLERINQIRMDEGVSNPLCINEKLMSSAQSHIDDMLANETIMLSHVGSDGLNSGERILRDGYDWTHYGATIFAQTDCDTVECSVANRPMFFSESGKYNQIGIAREEQYRAGGIRWYYIFATSDVDECIGMDVTMLEWIAGTPTMSPKLELYIPEPVDGDGSEMVEDWMIGMLSILNAERAHAGKDHFCYNRKLMIAAKNHTEDMAENDYVSHQGLDGRGPGHRAADAGYDTYSFMAENIAFNTNGYSEAMFAWMSSKSGHGYNIINPAGNHIGVAKNEAAGLYTLLVGNYHTENCIPSIACESTVHTQDDPLFDKYACSLCLQRRGHQQFGIMGCGFGIQWYKTGDLEAKFELFMEMNNIDPQMLDNETNLEDFAASIEHPIAELMKETVEGNCTVEVKSINGNPVGSRRLLQEDTQIGQRLLQGDPIAVVVEVEVIRDCKLYAECRNDGFVNEIQSEVSTSVTAEVASGNLTNAIIEQASINNVTVLANLTITPGPITINRLSVSVEEDEFEMTHFPTAQPIPTDAPTISPPANNNCDGAVTIELGTSVIDNTAGSTIDDVADCGVTIQGGGIWYKVYGNGNTFRASTCGGSTDFDTQISVWSGSCASLSCVGGNDDSSCGLSSQYDFSSIGPGTWFYILVHGFGTSTGTFELTVTEL